MPYRFEATSDFYSSALEVEQLCSLVTDENRSLFLKLAIVSLVTKFQVFIEKILEEFRFELNEKPSGSLSTYFLMNSLRISVTEGNALTSITNNTYYSDRYKEKIKNYLDSIAYFSDENKRIGESCRFKTKYPLGKTGKNELINLLKQIDGEENPFDGFGDDKIDTLDSLLQTRHLIIHQDRFSGTEQTVADSVIFVKELVEYIDNYLSRKLADIETRAATLQQ